MKGDDAEWFLDSDQRTGKTIRRVWRRVLVDPSLGARKGRVRRHLPLFQLSNPSIKDHLALFTHGVVGQWSVPEKIGRDYVDQMTAEVREEREDSRGRVKVLWIQKRRDNHYLDCPRRASLQPPASDLPQSCPMIRALRRLLSFGTPQPPHPRNLKLNVRPSQSASVAAPVTPVRNYFEFLLIMIEIPVFADLARECFNIILSCNNVGFPRHDWNR